MSQPTLVVKVGGAKSLDWDAVCDDVADVASSYRIVLVHGGSERTNEVATALGHPPQFVTSPTGYTSRLTDREALTVFQMVYCGEINKRIIERLAARGVVAVGLSGMDGQLWRGPRKSAIRVVEDGRTRVLRNNFTGRVDDVNTDLLQRLFDGGWMPVLTPPAISNEGEAINVDGDRAAAATAAAIAASQLIILSDVPGLLADYPDPSTQIAHLPAEEIETAAREFAQGRMRIKLLAAQEAIQGGVPRVVLADGRLDQPITRALAGAGTVIAHSLAAKGAS